jgi:hypothetical protein
MAFLLALSLLAGLAFQKYPLSHRTESATWCTRMTFVDLVHFQKLPLGFTRMTFPPGTTPFFGRERELARLKELTAKKSASLVVIKGRRRIGKSRLTDAGIDPCSSISRTAATFPARQSHPAILPIQHCTTIRPSSMVRYKGRDTEARESSGKLKAECLAAARFAAPLPGRNSAATARVLVPMRQKQHRIDEHRVHRDRPV